MRIELTQVSYNPMSPENSQINLYFPKNSKPFAKIQENNLGKILSERQQLSWKLGKRIFNLEKSEILKSEFVQSF